MIHISGVYYILHCGKKKWIKPVNSSMYHVYAGMFLSFSQLGNILVLFHWIYLNIHFSLSILSASARACMLGCLIVSHKYLALFLFFPCFFLSYRYFKALSSNLDITSSTL